MGFVWDRCVWDRCGGAAFVLILHHSVWGGTPHISQSGYDWRGGVRPRSYRGTRPRFASGTLMSLRTTPPLHAPKHCQGEPVHLPKATSGYPLGCSPHRSKEERSTREGGFPCRSVGRSAPAASHRNANTVSEPVSCRSYPAAHSREREPNAPRSAQLPASGQRRRQPQRCRCAPPARVRPNRQCR